MDKSIKLSGSEQSGILYQGGELELFAKAYEWKDYWTKKISQFLLGRVVDVGSGIGGNTMFLLKNGHSITELTMIEPDKRLHDQIDLDILRQSSVTVQRINGTLGDSARQCLLKRSERDTGLVDAILYADVLEHIEDDADELILARSILKPGGCIVVLAPAHNWLYSRFDESVGHFRRYDKKMMHSIAPNDAVLEKVFYLDSAGLSLSMLNKVVLAQSYPSKLQIMFWDKCIVRLSKILDKILGYRLGKSIIGIYRAV